MLITPPPAPPLQAPLPPGMVGFAGSSYATVADDEQPEKHVEATPPPLPPWPAPLQYPMSSELTGAEVSAVPSAIIPLDASIVNVVDWIVVDELLTIAPVNDTNPFGAVRRAV